MKNVSLNDIAKKLNLSFTMVCKIINKDPNYKPAKETKELVLKTAKKMKYDTTRLRNIYRRKYERLRINQPAKISIVLEDTKKVYDRGSCRVKNISRGGVLVNNLKFKKNCLPIRRFVCNVEITKGKLEGLTGIGKITRIEDDSPIALALHWRNLTAEKQEVVEVLNN